MSQRSTYSIRVEPELMQSIKIKAAQDHQSIADAIETAFKSYLTKEGL